MSRFLPPCPTATVAGLAAGVLGLAGLAGCGSGEEGATGAAATASASAGRPTAGATASGLGRRNVQAAIYPLAFATERVGGNRVQVGNLTAPGAEPHDLELSPSQVAALGEADLVVYLEGFQPAVDEAVEQAGPAALEVSGVVPLRKEYEEGEEHPEGEGGDEAAHGHGAGDPHVWLDPIRYAEVARAGEARLSAIDSEGAVTYRTNAERLAQQLEVLDGEFRSGLASCERRQFVTSHDAFGYLAARYDLEQVAIAGLSPDEEPSPAKVAEVEELVRERGITTVFYETLVSPELARSIAGDTGARATVLDPVEGVSEGSDYFSVMRANLQALRAANGCR